MADQLSNAFSVTAAELNRRFGDIRRRLSDGPVVIKHHGTPTMVLMSVDQYRRQANAGSPDLASAWRRKLQIILDHIREGYVSVDTNFAVQTINRVGELFVGRTRDELIGLPVSEAFPAMENVADFERVLQSGEIHRFERNSTLHPDRRVAVTMLPLPLPTGGVGVLFDNITEQTRARATLAEQDSAIRALLDAVDDRIVFTTDGDGRVDLWGAGATALLGWSKREIVGTPLAVLFDTIPEVGAVKSAKLRHKTGSTVNVTGKRTRLSNDTDAAMFVLTVE